MQAFKNISVFCDKCDDVKSHFAVLHYPADVDRVAMVFEDVEPTIITATCSGCGREGVLEKREK